MTPTLPAYAVLEQAPDAIVLVDAAGMIVYANHRVTHLFGVTSAALLGQTVETLIPERSRAQHTAHRHTFVRHPQVRPMGSSRVPLLGRRADGSEFPVDIHLAPVQNEGHRWTLALIRDATERHRFEDELREAKQMAEQVARMKGEFLALAAHDLSQPAQTLELSIGAIEHRVPPGSDIAEFTAQASAALTQMRELMRMLMEISRLEAGTMQVREEPVRVGDIFCDLERQFALAARAKDLQFRSDLCPYVLETDPALLRGMLSNLLSNAIRYTTYGEVRIRCVVPIDGNLRFEVSDTGIGIPSDQLERIFDDFHRSDEARRAHRDGFGLGLGIVRRLAILLGFDVTVQSTVGRGSTFTVHVPPHRVHHIA